MNRSNFLEKLCQAIEIFPDRAPMDEAEVVDIDFSGDFKIAAPCPFLIERGTKQEKVVETATPLKARIYVGAAEELRESFLAFLKEMPVRLKKKCWASWRLRWCSEGLKLDEIASFCGSSMRALRLMALGEYLKVWTIKRPDLTDIVIADFNGQKFIYSVYGNGKRP